MSKAAPSIASEKKRSDIVFFVLAAIVLVAGFYFVPKVLGLVPVSILAEGAGLNDLLSVVFVGAGFVAALWSSNLGQYSIELFKGAKVEARKITWSKREMVIRTTIMVLFMVFLATLFIFFADALIGFIVRLFI